MKKLTFSQGKFIAAAYEEDQFPEMRNAHGQIMQEIAVVGRSNVGKSSLINSLLRDQKLTKTSSTPGKTQSINFYSVDECLSLVDLPGYGYAKVPKTLKEKWALMIDTFLKTRKTLRLVLFLMDSRREPTEEDKAFMQWAEHYRVPLLIILTKADKLSSREKELRGRNERASFLYYSIKDPHARIELIQHINNFFT